MEAVLDVYKLPYNNKIPVVCMDESPKQLIENIATEEMKPGQPKRIDYEYRRHGMVNIFIANEPLRGKRFVKVTKTKKKADWALFLKEIADIYKDADKIILVMDNLATHDSSSFYEMFEPEFARELCKKFEFVFTPKHGSWLNMAEIELHILNHQCLNRHISTIEEVEREVKAWEEIRNNKKFKINWQFTNEKARVKLKRLYPSFSD